MGELGIRFREDAICLLQASTSPEECSADPRPPDTLLHRLVGWQTVKDGSELEAGQDKVSFRRVDKDTLYVPEFLPAHDN